MIPMPHSSEPDPRTVPEVPPRPRRGYPEHPTALAVQLSYPVGLLLQRHPSFPRRAAVQDDLFDATWLKDDAALQALALEVAMLDPDSAEAGLLRSACAFRLS